jgi:heme/copper-type cytochrome/quinol oxidase subunit 2
VFHRDGQPGAATRVLHFDSSEGWNLLFPKKPCHSSESWNLILLLLLILLLILLLVQVRVCLAFQQIE